MEQGLPSLVPHLAMSAAAGVGVWAVTGEPVALPAALAGGVLPDGDHLFDYYLKWVRRERRFLFLLLHGWEYLAAGIALYTLGFRDPWFLALVIGYATQIGADQAFNSVRWHTYLLTARAFHGFRVQSVLGRDDSGGFAAVVDSIPFGKDRIRRWFESRK